jgi:hypothetical protein
VTEIPQEAIDAAGGELAGYIAGPLLFVHAKDALEAALPFLRSQWEQERRDELLSDKVVSRMVYICSMPAGDIRRVLGAIKAATWEVA